MRLHWAGALVYLVALLVLGVWLPIQLGLNLLDPVLIAGYGAASAVFASALIGESMAATVRAALLGWLSAVVVLATGLAIVNARSNLGGVALPRASLLAGALLFGLAAAFFTACVGAFLLRRGWPESAARATLRRVFFVIVLALLFGERLLPDSLRTQLGSLFTTEKITAFLYTGAAALSGASLLISRRRVDLPQNRREYPNTRA